MPTDNMTPDQQLIYDRYKDIFPFQIVEFITELGIDIFTSAGMSKEISGAICKEDEKYVIYINESHSVTRNRFTLAHELGHYFYDKEYLDKKGSIEDKSKPIENSVLFRKASSVDTPSEMSAMDRRANKFAAELLMPDKKFTEIWNSTSSVVEVAKYFNISLEAVKIRAAVLLGEIF